MPAVTTLMPAITLLVATTNQGKLREIRRILEGVPVQLETLEKFAALPAPEETGRTFQENARLKARYYAAATGLLTVAEDSGLEIDALDGRPGVESARFGGVGSTYPEKFALIYAALGERGARDGADSEDRAARFVCALAVADRDRVVFESRGTIEGRIAPEPKGDGGFGYDPIFYYPPFGATLAEAGERKNEVSHRAAAFRPLREFLASAARGR
jgi:XTP/dITP diphosphohydrolase